MGALSVDQILITPLKRMELKGGDVLHGIKCTDPGFVNFGEAYFSMIEFGAIKPWKRHLRMTLNILVPVGMIEFVFIDNQGVIRQELAGVNRYVRLTVPPGIWFAFRSLVAPHSLLMNIADIPHDPAEIERKKLDEFIFKWDH